MSRTCIYTVLVVIKRSSSFMADSQQPIYTSLSHNTNNNVTPQWPSTFEVVSNNKHRHNTIPQEGEPFLRLLHCSIGIHGTAMLTGYWEVMPDYLTEIRIYLSHLIETEMRSSQHTMNYQRNYKQSLKMFCRSLLTDTLLQSLRCYGYNQKWQLNFRPSICLL